MDKVFDGAVYLVDAISFLTMEFFAILAKFVNSMKEDDSDVLDALESMQDAI